MEYVALGFALGGVVGFALGYGVHWLESIEERLVDYRFGLRK